MEKIKILGISVVVSLMLTAASYGIYTAVDNLWNNKIDEDAEEVDNSTQTIDLTLTMFLLGEDPQYIEVGHAYIEKGALASFPNGTWVDVTINSSNVNTEEEGNYTVSYTARETVISRMIIVLNSTEIENIPDNVNIAEMFSRVLLGEGVNESSAYISNNDTVHPIVLLDENGEEHYWKNFIPINWRPNNVSQTELVLLIKEEETEQFGLIAHYINGSDITRVQYSRNLTLYSSKTGEVLNSTIVFGSEPRECEETELSSLILIEGSHVSWSQIEQYLYYNNIDLLL